MHNLNAATFSGGTFGTHTELPHYFCVRVKRENDMSKYYVYIHFRNDTKTPFYVGKGAVNRKNRDLQITKRSLRWKRIYDKAGRTSCRIQEFENEQDAFEYEKYLIKQIGREDLGLGPLINFTDGGEGASNPSEESRKKRGASSKKAQSTPEQKMQRSEQFKKLWADENYQAKMLAIRQSEKTKIKFSNASKKRWEQDGYREKVMAARNAVNKQRLENLRKTKSSNNHKIKMSSATASKWQCPEHRAMMIAAMNTPEAKANRSAAAKNRKTNSKLAVPYQISLF